MKKTVLVLVALLMAAPAMATVTISANQVGDTAEFTLDYASDGADASGPYTLISGMAINVTISAGTMDIVAGSYMTTGESTNGAPGHGIYPGSIQFDIDSQMTSSGDPVAPGADPGALGDLPGNGCTVEAGALFDADANPSAEPLASGTIAKFAISGLNPEDCSTVTLALESVHRKGIVMRDGSAPSGLVLTNEDVCIPSACSAPTCWLDEIGGTQCNGNFAGPAYPDAGWAAVNSTDFLALKAAYLTDYWADPLGTGPDEYNPCADSDRDGYVNSSDFLNLKAYYLNDPVVGGCENACVTPWPPEP